MGRFQDRSGGLDFIPHEIGKTLKFGGGGSGRIRSVLDWNEILSCRISLIDLPS